MPRTCGLRLVSILVLTAGLNTQPLFAQPPRVPPRFLTKSTYGRVEILSLSRVRPFVVKEWVDPFLLVSLRVERTGEAKLDFPVVKEALDETHRSLIPSSNSLAAVARQIWEEHAETFTADADGVQWQNRIVALTAPQSNVAVLHSLKIELPYRVITAWHEARFNTQPQSENKPQEQGWARSSLQEFSVTGEGAAREVKATVRMKRLRGDPNTDIWTFRYVLQDSGGRTVDGVLTGTDSKEGLELHARWAALPKDFAPVELVFRFPSVEIRKVEVGFRDVPLP